jgi:hypothetical protein
MSAGVPYGSGPEEAAADAEPTAEHRAVTPPPAAPAAADGPPPAAEPGPGEAGQPFAIPGLPLDRPELHVGAAFAGGLLLALVLKRLAR